MKQVSTLFLKIIIILIGIPVLALCIFVLPPKLIEAIGQAANGAALGYIVIVILIVMYAATIPFYLVLHQTIKLLTYIEKDQAFSGISVTALKKIKNSAKIISCLYAAILPLVYIVAKWDDAPGLVLIGLVMIGASLVIAVFASVLQRLLQKAIEIKEENDLTV